MSVKMPQEKRRNRALLYENIVNEKFSGGVTMYLTPFLDSETGRRQTSDVRHQDIRYPTPTSDSDI